MTKIKDKQTEASSLEKEEEEEAQEVLKQRNK